MGGFTKDKYVPSSNDIPSGPKISAAFLMIWHQNLENPVVSRSRTTNMVVLGYGGLGMMEVLCHLDDDQ